MKRVFISYARTAGEQALARWIASALRNAEGIESVFLDEELLPAGELLRPALAEAIRTSHAVVFLISHSWTARSYPKQELEYAALADGSESTIRRIPVFREPRDSFRDLPEELPRVGVDWIDRQSDPYAALWQVYCGISGILPGEVKKHHQKGLPLGRKTGPPPEPPLLVNDHPSLECGRDREWADVSADPADRHRVVVIGGPRCECHGHFVLRMERFLAYTPPRGVAHVHWGTGTGAEARPQHKDDYLECLGRALNDNGRAPDRSQLATLLRARLAERNLVAVHPRIDSAFDDDRLIAYYREWLPELLAEAAPKMRLKCVQPVVWSGSGGIPAMARSLLDRGRSSPAALDWLCGKEERLARRLVRSLRDGTMSRLLLPVELFPMERRDVENFCMRKALKEEDCAEILRRTAGAMTSEKMLSEIDRYLIDRQRAEAERRAA